MNYFGKFVTGFKYFYDEINPSNMTGAIDVVVIKHFSTKNDQDKIHYVSSPFHVKFGKYDILRPKERLVDITINGNPVNLQLKLGRAGEAYFFRPNVDCDCQKCLHYKNYYASANANANQVFSNEFSDVFSIFFSNFI